MFTAEQADKLRQTYAGIQWQKIGIKHHHGIAVSLFSLNTKHSCGIGEYLDLLLLIDFCKIVGFTVLQLLPLNDTGNDSSPYNALSAFALNPLHLSLHALPNVERDSDLQKMLKHMQRHNSLQRVPYKAVSQEKAHFLQFYFEKYKNLFQNHVSYQEFVHNSSWLKPYALFKVLKKKYHGSSWEQWPKEESNPSPAQYQALVQRHHDEIEFYCMVQYLCDEQLKQAKEYAEHHSVFIKGDIPILISRDSADVWHHRKYFDMRYAAGAPPDMYSVEGQNWGFPIYDWNALKQDQYSWWKQRLSAASRYYHLYRIDHIVGFFRIWAIALNKSAKEGVFFPSDSKKWKEHGRQIMKIMLDATPNMLPIGEDLGTIPIEVRLCLKELGICGTKVMRWERDWMGDGRFFAPQEYCIESMTTVSTHDSETLAQWWKNQKEESLLLCHAKQWDYEPELSYSQRFAVLWDSHHTNSLFHINLLPEYLAFSPQLVWPKLEDERINVPGQVSDTNWSYRMRCTVEELKEHIFLQQLIRSVIQ